MFPSQKLEIQNHHGTTLEGFNGAGMFPSQKFADQVLRMIETGTLQWGRDVSIPEIRQDHKAGRACCGFNGAGMFPSQKLRSMGEKLHLGDRFNGAGMFPSQKFSSDLAQAQKRYKLQWGRDVSIPEIGLPLLGKAWHASLQWGRDVSIPEIRQGRFGHLPAGEASMGPGCFHPRN